MKTIGLVSCSAAKLKEAKHNPTKAYPAKDLYTGYSFKKSINEGLAKFGCDGYYILSGLHGLVESDEEIKYYNFYLGKQKAAYKREWSEKVYSKLQEKLGDLGQVEFIFFAGDAYCHYLKKRLNCKVLRFKNRRITFDVKEEHHG